MYDRIFYAYQNEYCERRTDMKKIAAVLTLLLLLSAAVFAEPVYKYEDTVPLTDTASLTNVREFYSDYNISYSYIKLNLEDERLKLRLLTSVEGTDILSTVSTLAKQNENTIGAINGDFFSVYSGNKGFSLGIEKSDGVISQSPIYPDTMATVAYDGRNVLMSYLDFQAKIVAPNGESKQIRHINKHTSYYGDLLMYTSEFNGGYSPAPGGPVVEMVVEDNIVKEFRKNMEPCKIPENGCVLVVSEGVSMFLAKNFSVGDEIKFEMSISPSLDDYDTAFGGGSMLVYEGEDVGKVGDYTHTVAGLNPRSAIGIDKEGKTLFLVAVDGRQTSSRGMRMSHLAELMISLGCYNAVNLDGGGSTHMVASTLWDSELHSVNRPTENRKVINAIGIVIDESKDEAFQEDGETSENTDADTEDSTNNISGIKIKPHKDVAFVGESIFFDVAAHNELLRSVDFDKTELVWSATSGEIKDGVLLCSNGGKVTVNTTFGDCYAETEVYVVDDISGIVTDDVVYMKKGEKHKLSVSVFDNSGRYIEMSDLSSFEFVSSDNNVVSVNGGEIYAENNGTAIVSVSRGNATSYISVAVGNKQLDYINSFEKANGKTFLYPADTIGSFETSGEYALNGSFSGKLNFDFTNMKSSEDIPISQEDVQPAEVENNPSPAEDVARGVYFSFVKDVLVDEDNPLISVSVYTEVPFNHRIKAQITDGNGIAKNLEFDGEIVDGKWNKLTLAIPEITKSPIYLSKIYVLYTPGEEKDSGCVYIDDISLVTGEKNMAIPAPSNKYGINTLNANVKSSVIIGSVSETDNNNPVTEYKKARLENELEGKNGIILSETIKKGVSEDDNAVYISLDTSNGGIRGTDSSQWDLLTSTVKASKKKNVFIITNSGVFGKDDFENEVVIDYLASIDKNVFVVSMGESSNYKNINGVKYFEIDSTLVTHLSNENGVRKNVLQFSFGDAVTFEFKSI